MLDTNKRIRLTVVVLLAVVALVAGLFVSNNVHVNKKIDLSEFHGTYLSQPREINHFALTGIDDKPFTNANLQGQWTMVFFGFTNCGYLCPTAMAELAKMYNLLAAKGIKTLPHVVMISVDPQRDSLDKLKKYVTAFNPNFYGATGNDEAIKSLTQEMGIAYTKVAIPKKEDVQNYDMEHTGTVILFNPQGELNAFFTTPHNAELLAKDYQMILPKT